MEKKLYKRSTTWKEDKRNYTKRGKGIQTEMRHTEMGHMERRLYGKATTRKEKRGYT